MKLREDDLGAYLLLMNAQPTPRALARLREKLAQPGWGARRRIRRSLWRVEAVATLLPLGSGELQLLTLQTHDRRPVSAQDAALISEALAQARAEGASAVLTRVPLARLSAPYRAALQGAGFAFSGERVEFKTPLDQLPGEAGTPLSWQPADTLASAAALLARCSQGDPDGIGPDADPQAALRGYLATPRLTSGLQQCVHIGMLDGSAVAFVCAQVDVQDGWSRITYMGLLPEVRGRGLGRWVHRHGFEMLRAQGGRLYHGGTRTDNAPMRACFERHACRPHAHLSEWAWYRG